MGSPSKKGLRGVPNIIHHAGSKGGGRRGEGYKKQGGKSARQDHLSPGKRKIRKKGKKRAGGDFQLGSKNSASSAAHKN